MPMIVIAIIFILVLYQAVFIYTSGKPVPRPVVSSQPQTLGSIGPKVSYVIIGDSTAVGQGASYNQSIAWLSADHLSKKYRVTLINLGIPGATTQNVLQSQVIPASRLHPDIVLIAVGANDVTHLTTSSNIDHHVREIITTLRQDNPDASIIFTGSPEMGSVPRFPWFVRQIATWRTRKINQIIQHASNEMSCTRIHIAEETGSIFHKHPELFTVDKFHPTAAGYNVWMSHINRALDSWHPHIKP